MPDRLLQSQYKESHSFELLNEAGCLNISIFRLELVIQTDREMWFDRYHCNQNRGTIS